MPELRVTHVVPALFGFKGVVGGAERYAYELARAMADEVPTKLVTFGEELQVESDGPLEIVILGNVIRVRGEPNNPISKGLFGALRDATVVHCHQQHVLASSLAALYCRIKRKKVFVSDLGGGGWDISAYMSTDGWYHGHLHISEYSRRVFGHEHNPEAHVILGGVDTDKFSPDPSAEYKRDVLFVGRVLPHKGVNYLIEALPEDMRLTIIGQAADERFTRDLEKLADGKQVAFVRDADEAALVGAYRGALCVVLPSVYTNLYGRSTNVPELLGQTLLEGMACGIPAVCTDVASMPEVVEHGVSGYVVPPNDRAALRAALEKLRDDPEHTKAMGRAARERVVGRFTWQQVVRRCLDVYEGGGRREEGAGNGKGETGNPNPGL